MKTTNDELKATQWAFKWAVRAGVKQEAMIRELIEIAEPCNPQDPTLLSEGDCPADHPNCCGRCDVIHRARKLIHAVQTTKRRQ